MLVSELGEFELIKLLARECGVEYPPRADGRPRHGFVVDLGDDAAVTTRRDGALIWTTDTMVAGVHFLPDKAGWRDVGWKALAVNLSDIAAMGGTPHLALITLNLPPDFEVDAATQLYRGLAEAAARYGVIIGGGDIVRAPVFSITVALSGWAAFSGTGAPLVMTRSASRPGDRVAVTGSLGDSAAGLALLKDIAKPDANGVELLTRHHRPAPRLDLAALALRSGVRCAIDISDGLVQDLGHIARASNAGIVLDANRLPLSAALTTLFPARALGFALSGGEDYELALVAPQMVMDALLASATEVPITLIGEVVRADEPFVSVLDERGQEIPLRHGGWDHLVQP